MTEKKKTILVKDWEELDRISNKESATHVLEVNAEEGCGWLKSKSPRNLKKNLSFMRQIKHMDVYLSTHTFYGASYQHSNKMFRACGFDIEVDNWDKEEGFREKIQQR